MKKRNHIYFAISGGLLSLFILFTVAVMVIDVKPVGPQGSLVGFSTMNQSIHDLLGVNMLLYHITDWLGLVAIFAAFGFGILGFVQLVKRKKLLRVDSSILVLGGFYLLVFSCYAFFEFNIVNYRPILINGVLEASYPSSTTMLVMCIMPTAMMQFKRLIPKKPIRTVINILCGMFTAFMVIGRMISGVHWFTDIMAGILLSVTLIMLYFSVNQYIDSPTES